MDFDLQIPTSQALPGFGAVIVLLLIVRHPSTRQNGEVIEVFMDPLLFLGCCAGFLRQLAQKSFLEGPDATENVRTITTAKEIAFREPEIPPISINKIGNESDPELERLISRTVAGLHVNKPDLCAEGVNGTYFLRDIDGKIIAIFKPQDEELSSPNNPKSKEEDPQRGILPGEAAVREVMASRLNRHFDDLFKVPLTGMVQITHPTFGNVDGKPIVKTGSLQEFVDNDGPVGDIGPQVFPVDEVHRVALLDLIFHNTDRHEGNILYRKSPLGHMELIPIDHGFSLPDRVGGGWFDWLHYPQARKPFSADFSRVVDELDAEEIAGDFELRPACRRTLELSVALVKKGVKMGLSPRQLGLFASRQNPRDISALEVLVDDAEKMSGDFIKNATRLMEDRLRSL